MSLLFDENLSPRLCALLADVFPESESVLPLGLGGRPDADVWSTALNLGLMVVSKDSDFVDRAVVEERGPKVIWIRLGNCTTESVHLVLRNSTDRIAAFGLSADSVLELP